VLKASIWKLITLREGTVMADQQFVPHAVTVHMEYGGILS